MLKNTTEILKVINEHAQLKKLNEIVCEFDARVFVIGGFVRDIILKRPSKDIDIVTDADAHALAKIVASHYGIQKIHHYKRYGTAAFKANGIHYEFVTARKESYQQTSRNPIVTPSNFEDDILRRDFTINTLAIELRQPKFALKDSLNGLSDLQHQILKTPSHPDKTFYDDPLRMLRAARFACTLNFTIQEHCFEHIKKNSARIKIVKQERITDELQKIIASPQPSKGLYILDKTGILEYVFPELTRLKGVDRIQNVGHKDNFIHTLKVLDNVAEKSSHIWLRWAALLHDIAKPQTKRFSPTNGWTFHGHEDLGSKMVKPIFERLKLPLDGALSYVEKLVRLHLRPIPLTQENTSDSALRRLLFDAGEHIDDLLLLCHCDITSKNEKKVSRFRENLKALKLKLEHLEQRDHIKNFQPPIRGTEIIDFLKIKPSKQVGDIKKKIKDAILDGLIENNKESALAYLKKIAVDRKVD